MLFKEVSNYSQGKYCRFSCWRWGKKYANTVVTACYLNLFFNSFISNQNYLDSLS
jgi:hypothetical protein